MNQYDDGREYFLKENNLDNRLFTKIIPEFENFLIIRKQM